MEQITTNDKLKHYIKHFDLTKWGIARLMNISTNTIANWTSHPSSKRYVAMPQVKLEILEDILRQKGLLK